MELSGKKALVLGASRGIGLAIARQLAAKGVSLVLPWFDWPESCRAMIDEFTAMNMDHLCLEADLRDPDAVEQMADAIAHHFGRLDILVNNIERGGMPVVHGSYRRAVNRDQWLLEMDTTLHAKWLVFDQCLELLRKAPEAVVVNISSIAAITGRSGPAGMLFNDGYAAASRGVSSLTETWARLGGPTIRVNEIMLGLVDQRHGPGTRGWALLDEDTKKQLLDHTLLGRTGTPEEVARAVLFLVRDAGFMTGSVIRMDGGYLLGGDRIPPMPDGVIEER
jgi:3-oxoacyl-[acyl-carrier protein] reductase